MTLECEVPDLTGEKTISGQVSSKQVFVTLLSELCDAIIEYLWSTEYEDMNENTAKKIVTLLEKKKKLLNVLDNYSKKTKNVALAAAAKQRKKIISSDFNNLIVKQKIAASNILPLSLELNLQDLEKMLATLCSDDFDHSVNQIEAMRRGAIEWAVEKVYLRSLNLDPFATTCVIPISCFASLVKSLLYIYNNTEDDFCMEWDVLKTYAIIGYQKIFTYLTTRYKQRSQDILNDLLNLHDTSFVPSPQILAEKAMVAEA
uniref:Uncharacterized protein n=1 Tax=Ditylenchus dipsaci TaxID=166011 RepID=A0A915DWX5_9BILA